MMVIIDDDWIIDSDDLIDYFYFELFFNKDNYYEICFKD